MSRINFRSEAKFGSKEKFYFKGPGTYFGFGKTFGSENFSGKGKGQNIGI